MAANSLIGWINYCAASAITAGSAATNLPATNVANDSGSSATAWQTVYGSTTLATGAWITIDPFTSAVPWDVIACFRTNLSSSASVTFTLYAAAGTVVWTTTLVGPTAGYGQIIALPPAGTIADYVTISFEDPTNADGFINVPLVFTGAAWRPLGSADYSSSMGRDVTSSEATSRGGQEFAALYYQRKRWSVSLSALRASETWSSMDLLNIYAANGSNVLFVPDINSGYVQQEAIFGRWKATSDLQYPYQAADRRKLTANITERL